MRVIAGLVVVVLVLVVGVAAYFYETGQLGAGIGGPGGPSSSDFHVNSAFIEPGGHLVADIANNGKTSTQSILPLEECAPDYTDCASLGAESSTFVLPAGSAYEVNLTLPQAGFSPNFVPGWGLPITGQTYYFEVQITLPAGNSINVPVAAVASGRFSHTEQFYTSTVPPMIALTAVTSSSLTISGNLSATMIISVSSDNYPTYGVTANLNNLTNQYGIEEPKSLASATWGCTSTSCPNVIASGPTTTITLATNLSTVTTGVSAGTYYLVTININQYGTFFFWVQAQNSS